MVNGMASLTADDWIRAAAAHLAANGVDAVRVEPLAASLGVSKGSFYWHFSNRDALLDAVLEWWRRAGVSDVVAQLEQDETGPEARLRALLRRAFAHRDCGFDVGVRAWAARERRAHEAAREVDGVRTDYVVSLLRAAGAQDPERRAAVVYRTLLGDYALRAAGAEGLDGPAVEDLTSWALGHR